MYASLHNCMPQNTPFYEFNKDIMEYVKQIKQGHLKCLESLFAKDDVTFRGFPKISIKVSAMWNATKTSFKTTVTLFLWKKSLIEIDFNI